MGVCTRNFSLLHDIIHTLRSRDIPFIVVSSLDEIPSNVGIVLTSSAEKKKVKKTKLIAADIYDDINVAVDKALRRLRGKQQYSRLLIGVDPGEYPGVVVFGDEVLLHRWHASSPSEVKQLVKRVLGEHEDVEEKIIRVGHGSLLYRNRIINLLIKLKVPVEIVDETSTTPAVGIPRFDKDVEAAAKIALIPGKTVKDKFVVTPTKGEIRDLQKKSRKLTDGRYSISESEAKQVLKGELSLDEILENK